MVASQFLRGTPKKNLYLFLVGVAQFEVHLLLFFPKEKWNFCFSRAFGSLPQHLQILNIQ